MRYVEARIDEKNREEAYRIFVTKSLQLAPQSQYITIDYTDLLNRKPSVEEPKSGTEIALGVMQRAGLRFGG